jgi:hypothetical protein
LQETFTATSYCLNSKETATALTFIEENFQTEEELHWFLIEGGYSGAFYFEYGDQGNGGHQDAVTRIELSREQFRIIFKHNAGVVSWDYMMSYTPERVWDTEQESAAALTELTIQFGFPVKIEDWVQIQNAVRRIVVNNTDCECLIYD